jgi:3-oxoacyl-[acyl-carrier protein] reductase
MRLAGKVAIVTGAGSRRGIGRATALTLAREGAAVAAWDSDGSGAEETAALVVGLGRRALGLRVDVTDEAQVREAATRVRAELGAVDILVNNAGITRSTPLLEITAAEWDLVQNVDLRGMFFCTKAVLPGMIERRYGRIVCVSSIAGKMGGGFFGSSHYAAAKAGIAGFAKSVARQMARHGITCNAVAPGLADTDIGLDTLDPELREKVRETTKQAVPLGRLASPQDIAYAILFLASDEASYITGHELDVNGGHLMD